MDTFEQVEILLVEDNPHDAELTMRALKKGGLANRLMWVNNGEQALDYLFRKGEYASREDTCPRLVLLDLKMPGMDGIEVLREIKADERLRRIPIVVMTTSQENQDMSQAYDLGVNSYVVKPIDFNSVTDIVRQAGYYWLVINRMP